MEENCFAIVCWFLQYNNENWPYIYIYIYIYIHTHTHTHIYPSRASPHPTPLGQHRVPAWAPCVPQQCSHQTSILYTIVYICQYYFLHLSHSLLPSLYLQVHSLSSLQIGFVHTTWHVGY